MIRHKQTKHGSCIIYTFRDYKAYLRWLSEQNKQAEVFDVKDSGR